MYKEKHLQTRVASSLTHKGKLDLILNFRIDADILGDFEEKVKSLSHLITTVRLGSGGSSMSD